VADAPSATEEVQAETPSLGHRVGRVAAWLGGVALLFFLLDLLGIDLAAWFASLWDALIAVDVEYIVVGLVLQTLQTLLSGAAWVAILRAAYPEDRVGVMPVITCYAVAVAANGVLPANLGTLMMLVMFTAIIPPRRCPA
jgi:uncharacterized membrane protein YbhN (UPF0104 family)